MSRRSSNDFMMTAPPIEESCGPSSEAGSMGGITLLLSPTQGGESFHSSPNRDGMSSMGDSLSVIEPMTRNGRSIDALGS